MEHPTPLQQRALDVLPFLRTADEAFRKQFFSQGIHSSLTVGQFILGILAVVFVLTSLVGTCPLYLPFDLSTRGQEAG